MQRESHLPSETPGASLAKAEPADQDIGVGDPLRAVVAEVLLGDDDAHRASFIPAWNSAPFYGGASDSPPACRERRRQSSDSWRRPPDRAFLAQLGVRRGDAMTGRRRPAR